MKKEKIKKAIGRFKRAAMLVMTGITLAVTAPALLVSASEELGVGQFDVRDIIDNGTALEDGPLAEFGNKVNDIGGGAYGLLYKAGIWLALCALVIAAFYLMFCSPASRGDAKSKIIATVGGILLLFAAASIVVFCQRIGMNLFTIS